ncbi:Fork-head domain-containing protein [Entamoeba marina]
MSLNQNLPVQNVISPCNCYFCSNKDVVLGKKRVPWTVICRYILLALNDISSKQYYSAHDDIYPFVIQHWEIFGTLEQFSDNNSWRKALLDAMNHSDQFESGTVKKRIGLWRLCSSTPTSPKKRGERIKPKKNKTTQKIKRSIQKQKILNTSNDINLQSVSSDTSNPQTINHTLKYQNDQFLLPQNLLKEIYNDYVVMHHSLQSAGLLLTKLPPEYTLCYNVTQRLLATVSRLEFELFEHEIFPSSCVAIRLL